MGELVERFLVERFEEHRPRLARAEIGDLDSDRDGDLDGEIENLGAWLTTVTARICLNLLRARANRREDPPRRARSGGRCRWCWRR